MPLLSLNIPRPEKRSGSFDDPTLPMTAVAVWNELDGGPTASGEIVTDRTAMAISTVYTCVTTLAEAVASLPCKLMQSTATGQTEATDHYLYDLLAYEPNPDMSSFTYWSTMVGCSALTGNGYAQITRDSDGTPNAFWPLHPLKTEPVRLPDGTLAFRTTDGMSGGAYRIVTAKDVIHLPLFALDGIKGIGPIRAARETYALAKAAEKFGGRWFSNGAHADSVLINKGPKPELKAQTEFRESWHQAYGGSNSGKQAILFGDWDLKTVGLSPEDSQFLGTRNFQRAEIAAMFHLQPHQVGDTSRLSNANHVQAQLTFVTDTLRPIASRIESELKRKLLPVANRNTSKLSVVFDLAERLRGDPQSQQEAYSKGRLGGWLSINDIRKDSGMNSIGPAGDVFLYPVNMGDAEQLLKDAALIPITQEPDPVSNPSDPVPKSKRSAYDTLVGVGEVAFRDAIGRAMHREKRTFDTLSTLFTPVLSTITAAAEQLAGDQFGLEPGWFESRDRVITSTVKAIEKRAANWTPDDSTIGGEMTKVFRTILFDTFREAAAALVTKDSTNA